MKHKNYWYTFFSLILLTLSVQGCLGIGDSNTQFSKTNGKVGVSTQALFQGKIYFTQGRNLYVLNGNRNVKQLTSGEDVRDPAVSPDGKTVAFIVRSKNYSDLDYMSTSGGPQQKLLSGNGHYYIVGQTFLHDTYYWFGQPSWAPDSNHLLFLSDIEKEDWYQETGQDAPMLDLQVFSISIHHPTLSGDQIKGATQDVAYADYGDGGDRDPGYRPGHPDQIIYTHYTYDKSQTKQLIQLFMEDPNEIVNHPEKNYHPGTAGSGFDPGIAITPPTPDQANTQPAFSPDGNAIAYIHAIDTTNSGLYVMQTPPDDITKDPNNPDMQKKALQSYQKASLIVSGQFISQPAWSPDGKQIAYLSYNNNAFDLWLANVSKDAKTGSYKINGSPAQLTQVDGGIDGDSRPFWSR